MSFMENLKKRLDVGLTKWEKKGFQGANRLHKYAVNGLLLFIAYNFYQFLSSYNEQFLHIRQSNKFEEGNLEGPINSDA